MNEYMFYTDEGYCEAPNGKSTENYQVLGLEKGNTKEDALQQLLNNNSWINENGYNPDKIIAVKIQK